MGYGDDNPGSKCQKIRKQRKLVMRKITGYRILAPGRLLSENESAETLKQRVKVEFLRLKI